MKMEYLDRAASATGVDTPENMVDNMCFKNS